MIELYKVVQSYWGNIVHEKSGEHIKFQAQVSEGPSEGRYVIKYSHDYQPVEGAMVNFGATATHAKSIEEAKSKVEKWAEWAAKSL